MTKKIAVLAVLAFTLILGLFFTLVPVEINPGDDIWLHFLGFFLLTSVISWVYMTLSNNININKYIFFMFIFGSVLAALTEKLQSLTPFRSCQGSDWIANVAGMSVSLIGLYLYVQFKNKK